MKLRPATIAGLAILVISVGAVIWIYYSKGWLNEVIMKEKEAEQYYLYGKRYEGSIKNPAFEAIFTELEKAIHEYDTSKFIVVYYEQFPDKDSEFKTKAIVGVTSDADSLVTIKGGDWSYYKINTTQSIFGVQDASLMVTSVYNEIEDYAETKNYELSKSGLIEYYYHPNRFGVEIPFQKIKKDQ